jgi:uncharacterized protein YycO
MRGGDVLLFHRPTSWANARANPRATLFTALIHLATRSRWNHAAIAVDELWYDEATAAGVVRTHLAHTSDEVLVVPIPYRDEGCRLTAIAWAEARTGERYGYLNAILCGLNNVLVGLGLVIKRTDAIICSELVAEALERAGFDFGKDSALVAPGDLATAFGVER